MRLKAASATPTGSWVQLREGKRQKLGLLIFLFSVIIFFIITLFSPSVAAVQTVPYKVNFQGYLRDSTDQVLADGQYNITFRLFDAATAGTQVWSEVRQETTRVTLTDGYFSVQLGDVSPLSPTVFTSGDLYLEIELPTPATATCSTNGCASYAEGPMTPRQPIASSAYAFNADQLDGYDSSDFALIGESNTFTNMNTFKADSAAAFAIQNANGDSLLVANTSTMKVTIGTSTNGVTLSVNGIELAGTARGTKKVTLIPEYAGATFRGDGTDNIGNLSSDFCSDPGLIAVDICNTSGEIHNYYEWTSAEATAQDYDIYVLYQMPSDYDYNSISNFYFTSQVKGGANAAIRVLNDAGTECASNLAGSVDEWGVLPVTVTNSNYCILAGALLTFKITLSSSNGDSARAGEIRFDYRSTF